MSYRALVNLRSIILAITCVLAASVFAIYFLATKETHDLFAEGPLVRATVVRVKKSDPPRVTVKFTPPSGKAQESTCELTAEADAKLKPGDAVDVHLHERSPGRVATKRGVAESDPSPAILLGTVACLALGGYLLFLPRLQARRRAARTSPLDVITDSLRRTRTLTLSVGFGIVAFGAFMIWLGASGADRTATTGTNIAVAVIGGIFAAFGLFIAARGFGLRSIEGSWIMEIILQRPQEIAWIYEQVVQHAVAGDVSAMASVYLWFNDGRSYNIAVQREDAAPLIGEISRRAPHALVGFTRENEEGYRRRRAA